MYLDKKWKIVIAAIIAIIIYIFFIEPIHDVIKYRHKIVKNDYRRFLWLLNDSVKLDNTWGNDTLFSVTGNVRESHQYFNYNLEGGIYVHILEFKDLDGLKIGNIHFNYLLDFKSFTKRSIGILNEDVERWPSISIKYKLPFNDSLSVNFDQYANLIEIRDTINCKAFFGSLTTMSLSNAENEHLVLFDFTRTPEALISFYTARSRFFIIIITSKHSLDERCINLLKLN